MDISQTDSVKPQKYCDVEDKKKPFLKGKGLIWWALMDSNQRPDRYERPALTN